MSATIGDAGTFAAECGVKECQLPRRKQWGFRRQDFMKYSGKMFLQRTSWMLEQGLGRTRRGRDEDYDPGTGLVCIADKNWHRVQKYLSQATRDAIVET